jgi:hypothetical protein
MVKVDGWPDQVDVVTNVSRDRVIVAAWRIIR